MDTHKGGMGMLKIGRALGVGTDFVQRVLERRLPLKHAEQE
jgi:hypothetical protein